MSITKMDANGRILLPMGIRDKLDLNNGDKLAIDQLGDGTIILKKLAEKLSSEKEDGEFYFKLDRIERH
jgi:AbrB family looped-hinge helix DNA binding protein